MSKKPKSLVFRFLSGNTFTLLSKSLLYLVVFGKNSSLLLKLNLSVFSSNRFSTRKHYLMGPARCLLSQTWVEVVRAPMQKAWYFYSQVHFFMGKIKSRKVFFPFLLVITSVMLQHRTQSSIQSPRLPIGLRMAFRRVYIFTPSIRHDSWKNFAVNCGPLSVSNVFGGPCVNIHSSQNAFAIFGAVVERHPLKRQSFVNLYTTTTMKRCPDFDLGGGQRRSMATLLRGDSLFNKFVCLRKPIRSFAYVIKRRTVL